MSDFMAKMHQLRYCRRLHREAFSAMQTHYLDLKGLLLQRKGWQKGMEGVRNEESGRKEMMGKEEGRGRPEGKGEKEKAKGRKR